MQLLKELRSIISPNKYLKIRKDAIFLNENHQEKFKKNGWIKFENLIDTSTLDDFKSIFNVMERDMNFTNETCFINTGCNCNLEYKNLTTHVIQKHVPAIFSKIFIADKIEMQTGGSFVIKPPHENSKLDIHQDGSFIDEEIDYSAMLWFPLVDVVDNEGLLGVISGSHLWGSTQRGFSVPWAFEDHKEILKQYIEPIKVKKGDAVVFDCALFHSSLPNLSKSIRPALLIGIAKKNAQLIYYYPSDEEAYLEKYYVDNTFFESYDFENPSRPDATKWKVEKVKRKKFEFTERQLTSLLNRN